MNVLDMDRATIADALDVMAHGRATSERSRLVRDYAAGQIRYNLGAREIYSYGTHFPLLRFVPRGRRPLVVLNGDAWRQIGPSRTRDHQAIARELAGALGETCVIPFSALRGAGIDIDTVRPIHTRDDAQWTETVTAPAHRAPSRITREWVQVDRTAHTIRGVPADRRKTWRYANGTSEYRNIPRGDDGLYHWTESVERPVPPDADGLYRWRELRHRLGDCLFSAVREETYLRPAKPFEVSRESARARFEVAWRDSYCNAAPAATDNRSDLHEAGPSGACIHCGRALETRVTVRRRGRYLSSFDYNENPPLYFLAEVPRGSGADTVESAIEALAPRAVHAARARSIPVERQGDVFFIRTGLDDSELEERGIVSRARLTLWTRTAKPRKGEPGYVEESPKDRRRRLERMRAERRREFRRLHAESFERAMANPQKDCSASYRRWNPTDQAYLTDGNRARHAWWHAVENTRERYTPPAESWDKRREAVRRALAIYGTAHTAREVIRTRSGAVYVRGTVRHLPALEPGRTGTPDHRPLVLDPECWYLAVRNTVPRQTRRRAL